MCKTSAALTSPTEMRKTSIMVLTPIKESGSSFLGAKTFQKEILCISNHLHT